LGRENRLTITKNTVQLVLREESEPADSIELVLAEVGLDLNRDVIWYDLAPVEQL